MAKLKILLAEDNMVNQKVASFNIQKIGHLAIIANNGEEAVELFQKESFDLVLMDLQMPKMDGYEASISIRKLEEEENRDRCIIICLTAFVLNQEKEKCFNAGMDDFLSKPFQGKQLEELINKYFPSENI